MANKRKNRRAARIPDASSSDAPSPEYVDAPFSPRCAFVVQFRTGKGKLTGRVEHMTSGEAAIFSDLKELCEFFKRVLEVSAHARKPHHND
jgi:hypothetical protein